MSYASGGALIVRMWSEVNRNDPDALRISLAEIDQRREWNLVVESFPKKIAISSRIRNIFHTHWTQRGEYIRGEVGNDRDLADILKYLLPRYYGPKKLLYRGESLERWRDRCVGLCWTDNIEVAAMFARVRNNVKPHGGVVLVSTVPCEEIIAAPGQHSVWLGESEYLVDSTRLTDIQEHSIFPAFPV